MAEKQFSAPENCLLGAEKDHLEQFYCKYQLLTQTARRGIQKLNNFKWIIFIRFKVTNYKISNLHYIVIATFKSFERFWNQLRLMIII